jgi:hypothetical protein
MRTEPGVESAVAVTVAPGGPLAVTLVTPGAAYWASKQRNFSEFLYIIKRASALRRFSRGAAAAA